MAGLEKFAWSRSIRITSLCVREGLAEFMGTSILTIFATGAGLQYTLGRGMFNSYLSINIVSGLAVMMATYMCGGLTEALDEFDGGVRSVFGPTGTAGAFCSFPQEFLSTRGGLLDQVVGGGLLCICGLCILDKHNLNPHRGLTPIPIGLSVTAIGGSFGFNCGYPLNPAMDFGRRFFIFIAGWGSEVFSYRNYNWFWVPIVGPFLGASAAAFIYWIFIDVHWPEKTEHSLAEIQQLPVGDNQSSVLLAKHENVTLQAHSNEKPAINDRFLMKPPVSETDLRESLFITHF